jgi:hypothetical protein
VAGRSSEAAYSPTFRASAEPGWVWILAFAVSV